MLVNDSIMTVKLARKSVDTVKENSAVQAQHRMIPLRFYFDWQIVTSKTLCASGQEPTQSFEMIKVKKNNKKHLES